MVLTEKEKMLAGELYTADSPEIPAETKPRPECERSGSTHTSTCRLPSDAGC